MLQEFITKSNQRLKARILEYLGLELIVDDRLTRLVESAMFECTIDAAVDARIEDYDYSSIVESCLCDMDLSCMIESVLEDMDLGEHIDTDELSRSVTEKIAAAIRRYSL